MEITSNLKLQKPEDSDVATQDPFNDNSDTLDKEIGSLKLSSQKWNEATEGINIIENIIINKNNWIKEENSYIYKIKSDLATIKHFPIFAAHKDYVERAKLIYSIEAKDGEIILYSELPPLYDLRVNITLLKGVV